jgi:hypothetical protein
VEFLLVAEFGEGGGVIIDGARTHGLCGFAHGMLPAFIGGSVWSDSGRIEPQVSMV